MVPHQAEAEQVWTFASIKSTTGPLLGEGTCATGKRMTGEIGGIGPLEQVFVFPKHNQVILVPKPNHVFLLPKPNQVFMVPKPNQAVLLPEPITMC